MNTNLTPERALLYSLLRSALNGEELPPGVFDGADEEVFARLYSLAYAHDLTHIFSNGIAGAANSCPAKLREKFEKQKTLAIFRVQRLMTEQARIFEELGTAGIPHVALKGAVLRPLYITIFLRYANSSLLPKNTKKMVFGIITTMAILIINPIILISGIVFVLSQ